MDNLIENWQVDNITSTSSDHSVIKATLRIRALLKRQKLKKKRIGTNLEIMRLEISFI